MFMELCFPDLLKYAEVVALFKRLDNLDKENYRPVSVVTALLQIFKKSRVYIIFWIIILKNSVRFKAYM